MKLKHQFLIQEPGNELSAVYNSLIRKSSMGCFVIGCLAEDTTEAAIVEQLRALYDVPGAEVEAGVAAILETLRKNGALEE